MTNGGHKPSTALTARRRGRMRAATHSCLLLACLPWAVRCCRKKDKFNRISGVSLLVGRLEKPPHDERVRRGSGSHRKRRPWRPPAASLTQLGGGECEHSDRLLWLLLRLCVAPAGRGRWWWSDHHGDVRRGELHRATGLGVVREPATPHPPHTRHLPTPHASGSYMISPFFLCFC